MGSKVQKREQQGKRTSVHIRGAIVPEGKLRKALARHSHTTIVERFFSEQYWSCNHSVSLQLITRESSPKLPDDITMSTPRNALDFASMWNTTPWMRFQRAFQDLGMIDT